MLSWIRTVSWYLLPLALALSMVSDAMFANTTATCTCNFTIGPGCLQEFAWTNRL